MEGKPWLRCQVENEGNTMKCFITRNACQYGLSRGLAEASLEPPNVHGKDCNEGEKSPRTYRSSQGGERKHGVGCPSEENFLTLPRVPSPRSRAQPTGHPTPRKTASRALRPRHSEQPEHDVAGRTTRGEGSRRGRGGRQGEEGALGGAGQGGQQRARFRLNSGK